MFGLIVRRKDNTPFCEVEFRFSAFTTITRKAYGYVFYHDEKKSYLVGRDNEEAVNDNLMIVP